MIGIIDLFPGKHVFYQIGKEIFESREAMWVALTGLLSTISIATVLFSPIFSEERKEEEQKIRLIKGLKSELRSNFRLVFTSEIERKIEWTMLKELKENQNFVKNTKRVNIDTLIDLYKESEYFETIVSLFRLKDARQVNEKHAHLCKYYLEFIYKFRNKGNKQLQNIKELIEAEKKEADSYLRKENMRFKKVRGMEGMTSSKLLEFEKGKIRREQKIFEDYRNKLNEIYNRIAKPVNRTIAQFIDELFDVS